MSVELCQTSIIERAMSEGRVMNLHDENNNAHILIEPIGQQLLRYSGKIQRIFKNGAGCLQYINDYLDEIDVAFENELNFLEDKEQYVYLPINRAVLLEVILSNSSEQKLTIERFIFNEDVMFYQIEEMLEFLTNLKNK